MNIKDNIKKITKKIYYRVRFIIKSLFIKLDPRIKFFIFITPNHNNIGDLAILLSEEQFVKRYFSNYKIIEINNYDLEFGGRITDLCRKKDIITIHGGGFLGTLWPGEELYFHKVINAYPKRKIVTFPQTVYYDKSQESLNFVNKVRKVYESNSDLCLNVREQYSYTVSKELFPNTKIDIIPDIVFFMKLMTNEREKRENILLCFRDDSEKTKEYSGDIREVLTKKNISFTETDMIAEQKVTYRNRNRLIRSKFQEFADAKAVITDRLHAMIFSALTYTPCVVLPSKSHKVEGVYEWIRELGFIEYIESLDDLEKTLDHVVDLKKENKELYNKKFEYYYEKLRESIGNG